jgi:ER-bound oxygenase mpaB/B'/Rubber oxygenase, catalytic domain
MVRDASSATGDNSKVREWDDEFLDSMRQVGDPLADAVAARVLDEGQVEEVRHLLQQLLDHDDVRRAELPDHVREYLDQTAALPDWADPERMRRGEIVFERWGVAISVALFCASLPSAYACAKGVSVLAQTARLETDTRRRIMETGQFLIDVLGPGGMAPGGKGIMAIQRVRLMHAAIRHLILAHGWDSAELGLPINQEDLAGTLLSFSYTLVEPLPRLGMALADDEVEDFLYVWRVVGEMMGVDARVVATDIAESTELVNLIRRRQFAESADGIAMTDALVGLLQEMTPTHILDSVVPDLIRMLSGDEVAELIGLPPRARHFGLLTLLKVLVRFTTHEVENDRVLQRLSDHVGWWILNGLFDIERQGEHRTAFDIPDELANHWKLHVEPA